MRTPQAGAALVERSRVLAAAISENIPVVTGELKAEWGDMSPSLEAGADGVKVALPIGSWRWHFVEFGTVHNAAYAPIRKGADSARMRIDMNAGRG